MVIQKGTHVYLIHATTTHSVRSQDQVSIVRVPLVGRVKDAKVGTKEISAETLKDFGKSWRTFVKLLSYLLLRYHNVCL